MIHKYLKWMVTVFLRMKLNVKSDVKVNKWKENHLVIILNDKIIRIYSHSTLSIV